MWAISFTMEFLYMEAEKRYQALTHRLTSYLYPTTEKPTIIQQILGLSYNIFCIVCRTFLFYFALGPFVMKSFWGSINLMNSLYWYGYILCFLSLAIFIAFPPKVSLSQLQNSRVQNRAPLLSNLNSVGQNTSTTTPQPESELKKD